MSLTKRIIIYGLIGIVSGLFTWPFAELVIFFQPAFPNLMVFSVVTGIVIGLFMGGLFGMSEGIISISKKKLVTGLIMGMLIGTAGGIVGFIAGQSALLFTGTFFFNSNLSFKTIGFPLSKALGWSIFGAFIGLSEGIRSRSLLKVRNGFLGGIIGGILGGLTFEYLRIFLSESYLARLAGLVLLGLLIGVFYGLIENKMAKASLFLLNGSFKGREFPLTQKRTLVGSSATTVVSLSTYQGVEDVHTEITREKEGFILTHLGRKKNTYINDEQIDKKKLDNGDIIRIGDAQFQFKTK